METRNQNIDIKLTSDHRDEKFKKTIEEISVNGKDNNPYLHSYKYKSLTAREVEIMNILILGKLNKEIADALNLSIDTVRAHLRHIFPKLNTENRAEAIVEYLKITGKIKSTFSVE